MSGKKEIVHEGRFCQGGFMIGETRLLFFAAAVIFVSAFSARGDELLFALGERKVIQAPTFQPTSQVAWDATGDGNEELMAYQSPAGEIVVMETKAYDGMGDLGLEIGLLRTFSSALGNSGTVFSTDMDGDGENDLVLLTNEVVRIWNGGVIRAADAESLPDFEFAFTGIDPGELIWSQPADLNGDGSPDFVFYDQNSAAVGILTGFNETEPRFVFPAGDFADSFSGLYNPQVVRNWDGAGQDVVANLSRRTGGIVVYAFDSQLNAVEIDEVPADGFFAQLKNGGLPELVCFGDFGYGSPYSASNPPATVYEKLGEEWIAKDLPVPDGMIEYDPFVFPNPFFAKVAEGGSGMGESVYFGRTSVSGGYYRIIPSVEDEPLRLVIEQSDATFPLTDLSPLRLPNRSGEVLAIRSTRTGRTDIFGNPASGIMLSLRRPDEQGILTDAFSLGGSAGDSFYTDVDVDGIPDLVSLRRGDAGVTVHYQPNNPSLAETVTYPSDSPSSAERLVAGNFSGSASVEFAISGGAEATSIPVFRLSPLSLSQTGSTLPTCVLGSGDFTSDGADELLYLSEADGTLRYSSFNAGGGLADDNVIALAGHTVSTYQGISGVTGNEGFVKPRQVLIVDADGDGDDDIITYPSALGQRIALHRNYGGMFSLEPLSGVLDDGIFGAPPEEDGVVLAAPTHLLAGHFLQGSGPSLVTYGSGSDPFGNPLSSLTSWSGSLENPTAMISTSTSLLTNLVVADLDGDGLDDIIASGGAAFDVFGNPVFDPSLRYFRSRGDGTFADAVVLADQGVLISQIIVEDIDLDGVPDVTAVSEETNSIEIFRGLRVPPFPSFTDWAAEYSPASPGPLDRPSGGEPNLVLFTRGDIPSSSAAAGPPAPPASTSVSWNGVDLKAIHPVPRLADGQSVDVILQYSSDLEGWIDVEESNTYFSQDATTPQWSVKHTEVSNPPNFGAAEIFFRFKVIHISQ